MIDFYEGLFKECLGGKGAPGVGEVRLFVAPFKNSPESAQDLRDAVLTSLMLYKGEKLVCSVPESMALQYAVVCAFLKALTGAGSDQHSTGRVQAFIGKIITSIHELGLSGSEWASKMTEDILRVCQKCETPGIKSACCTVLAAVGFSLERYEEIILKQLYHCVCDSRAAVREAAVAALGRVQVCLLVFHCHQLLIYMPSEDAFISC
jgi:hypothetical protein